MILRTSFRTAPLVFALLFSVALLAAHRGAPPVSAGIQTITICKDTTPPGATGFPFTWTAGSNGPQPGFMIDDQQCSVLDVSGLDKFNTITEVVPVGWTLTNITCNQVTSPVSFIGANPNAAFQPGDDTVQIDLNEANVTCTFFNTMNATHTPTPTPTVTPTSTPCPPAVCTPTPTPTCPIGTICTPTPTLAVTPTPTATATPTPTASPAAPIVWGDDNCSAAADPVDSLLTLRFDAGLAVDTGDCPAMGQVVDVQNASPHPWGDIDCSGEVSPVDSLKLLRFDAGLSVDQAPDCPVLGDPVTVMV
ncbi:MAG: hypothetical protein WD904_08290 [Dehalococcoidia bacterium]